MVLKSRIPLPLKLNLYVCYLTDPPRKVESKSMIWTDFEMWWIMISIDIFRKAEFKFMIWIDLKFDLSRKTEFKFMMLTDLEIDFFRKTEFKFILWIDLKFDLLRKTECLGSCGCGKII